ITAGERTWSHLAECTVWLAGQNADSVGRCKARNDAHLEKRGLYALLAEEVSRERQNVKYRKASTNRCLPIAAGIPCKTESRLKVKLGGVRVIRADPGAARLSKYKSEGRIRRLAVGQRVSEVGEVGN